MQSAFLIVAAGRLLSALLALVTLRLATADLEPEQYGVLALLVAVQFGSNLLLINPVAQYINRFTHAWWDEGTLLTRLRHFLRYLLLVSLLASMLGVAGFIPGEAGALGVTTVALFFTVLWANWSATLLYILNMLGFRARAVLWTLAGGLISLGASLLFVRLSPSATAWFAGQAVGAAISGFCATLTLRHEARRTGHASGEEPLLSWDVVRDYCLPLAAATGLMWLQLSGWRFMAVQYWGLAMTGVLVAGLTLVGQVWAVVESLAMQYLYPLFFRRISGEQTSDGASAMSDLLNVLGPIYLALTGAIILAAPCLVRMLVDPRYADAAAFAVLGAMIECGRVLANVLGLAAQVTRRTSTLAWPYFIGAMAVLGGVAWAGSHYLEIRAGVFALLAGAMVMLLAMYVLMRHQLPFVLDGRRWLAALVIAMASSTASLYFPLPDGLWAALAMLALIGALTVVTLACLLWRSSALQRLLATPLRKSEVMV